MSPVILGIALLAVTILLIPIFAFNICPYNIHTKHSKQIGDHWISTGPIALIHPLGSATPI